jgi:hypothetical protein
MILKVGRFESLRVRGFRLIPRLFPSVTISIQGMHPLRVELYEDMVLTRSGANE